MFGEPVGLLDAGPRVQYDGLDAYGLEFREPRGDLREVPHQANVRFSSHEPESRPKVRIDTVVVEFGRRRGIPLQPKAPRIVPRFLGRVTSEHSKPQSRTSRSALRAEGGHPNACLQTQAPHRMSLT